MHALSWGLPGGGGMRYGSVCSGIEAATAAWHPLGWKPAFFSEIEKFPRAVLAHHYPDVPLHGDFTTIEAGQYEPIDLLVGGTPCQSFSIAGLRGGLGDDRGNLALEYLRLADRLRPRWLVWENVPGVLSSNGGRDFGSILGGMVKLGYCPAWRILDAKHFGVPQRRRRVFVVGYLGDWRRAASVLFERESLRGDSPPRREARKDVAPTISSRPTGGGGLGTDFDLDGGVIAAIQERAVSENASAGPDGVGVRTDGVAYTLEARQTVQAVAYGGNNQSGPIDVAATLSAHGGRQDFESETFIAHALRGEGFDASEDGTGRGTPIVPTLTSNGDAHSGYRDEHGLIPVAFAQNSRDEVREMDVVGALAAEPGMKQTSYLRLNSAVRRLTPRECERLQGFKDDFTAIPYRGGVAADGPRYKALGNSMAVPVMAWLGRRIEMADKPC